MDDRVGANGFLFAPPLRTVRESFPSHGSSSAKARHLTLSPLSKAHLIRLRHLLPVRCGEGNRSGEGEKPFASRVGRVVPRGENPCSKQERAGGVDRHSCRALDASFTRRHSAGVRHLTTDLPQSRRTGGITVHAISRTRLSTRGTVRALHILPRLIGCPRRRGWKVVRVVIGTVRVAGGTCRVAGTRLPGASSGLRMAGGLNSLAGMDE